ncbi:MAG: response regulator [Acidobacteriota bacterium]
MSRKVLAAVADMFFAAKIDAAARQQGILVEYVRTAEALLTQARAISPALILLDLNNTRFDTLAALEQLKADMVGSTIPVIGFLSHVQVERRRQAESLGCDRVMARSEFSTRLSEILSGNFA